VVARGIGKRRDSDTQQALHANLTDHQRSKLVKDLALP
jgi:hypothetical protein